eukprot:8974628-Lingulodinium_polyedra.AAC.1
MQQPHAGGAAGAAVPAQNQLAMAEAIEGAQLHHRPQPAPERRSERDCSVARNKFKSGERCQ